MAGNNDNSKKSQFRQISNEELEKILEDHKKWLESKGEEGKQADLSNTILDGKEMEHVNLEGADLRKAVFSKANLIGANLAEADLRKADLHGADLRSAHLMGANFQEAFLGEANLRKAYLHRANFEKSDVIRVKFSRGRYKYLGINTTGCFGSQQFKRFAQDQSFLDELLIGNIRQKILYWTWLIFADRGRTPWFWMGWSAFFPLGFALVFYYHLGSSAFDLEHLCWNLNSMIYYGVVTFTTLGFGDIKPLTNETALWVMAEVILGYIMLGGLISILATIIARRS
jgi:hypothetical protein